MPDQCSINETLEERSQDSGGKVRLRADSLEEARPPTEGGSSESRGGEGEDRRWAAWVRSVVRVTRGAGSGSQDSARVRFGLQIKSCCFTTSPLPELWKKIKLHKYFVFN